MELGSDMVRAARLCLCTVTLANLLVAASASDAAGVRFPFRSPSSPVGQEDQTVLYTDKVDFEHHCFGFIYAVVGDPFKVKEQELDAKVKDLCAGSGEHCALWAADLYAAATEKAARGRKAADLWSDASEKVRRLALARTADARKPSKSYTQWCAEVWRDLRQPAATRAEAAATHAQVVTSSVKTATPTPAAKLAEVPVAAAVAARIGEEVTKAKATIGRAQQEAKAAVKDLEKQAKSAGSAVAREVDAAEAEFAKETQQAEDKLQEELQSAVARARAAKTQQAKPVKLAAAKPHTATPQQAPQKVAQTTNAPPAAVRKIPAVQKAPVVQHAAVKAQQKVVQTTKAPPAAVHTAPAVQHAAPAVKVQQRVVQTTKAPPAVVHTTPAPAVQQQVVQTTTAPPALVLTTPAAAPVVAAKTNALRSQAKEEKDCACVERHGERVCHCMKKRHHHS